MSNATLEQVRSKGFELNASERAELAHNLIASLDGEADQGVAEAWDSEFQRRLKQIDDGSADFIDHAELKRRMHQHLAGH